jgi:hypothetical protein
VVVTIFSLSCLDHDGAAVGGGTLGRLHTTCGLSAADLTTLRQAPRCGRALVAHEVCMDHIRVGDALRLCARALELAVANHRGVRRRGVFFRRREPIGLILNAKYSRALVCERLDIHKRHIGLPVGAHALHDATLRTLE